jgi:hypothetical protein
MLLIRNLDKAHSFIKLTVSAIYDPKQILIEVQKMGTIIFCDKLISRQQVHDNTNKS